VLNEATKLDSPQFFEAQGLLTTLLDQHHPALDVGGVVQRQYERCIARCRQPGRLSPEWLKKWFASVMARGRVYWHDGSVPRRHWRALLSAPYSFDDDDEAFVGVAHRTPDKLLVSEDGDYTTDVKAYVSEHLGVQVLTVGEARERVSG